MRLTGTWRRSLGIAAVLALAWSVGGASSAGAAGEITELGWWTRSPLSSAPDGGFAVGAAPDGVTAVAALRVDVGGGVETLVLEVEAASDAVALGSLEVCLAPDGWTAASAGALDDAPATACEGPSVPFARAGTGTAFRADVSSLVQSASGAVSLAVVPIAGSGTVPYEVTFEPPAATATGASGAPSTPTPTPSPTPSPGPTGPTSPGPSSSPSFSPAPSSSSSPFSVGSGTPSPVVTLPAASPAAPPASPAVAPEAPEDDDGASSTIELANAGLLDDVTSSDPRWGEAFVLVLIGFGVGAAVYGFSRLSAARAATTSAA